MTRLANKVFSNKFYLRKQISETLSHNGGRLNFFDLHVLNGVITVTVRFVGLRDMEQNISFVFSPAVLSKEEIMFVGAEKFSVQKRSEIRFSYSPTCTMEKIFHEVIVEVRKQTNGSRNEYLALAWFKRLSGGNKTIQDVKLSSTVDDLQGVDLLVKIRLPYEKPVRVPIQIKSHKTDQWQHRQNPRRWHVPSIMIDHNTMFEDLHQKMTELLMAYVKNKRVMHISRFGSWLGVFAP